MLASNFEANETRYGLNANTKRAESQSPPRHEGGDLSTAGIRVDDSTLDSVDVVLVNQLLDKVYSAFVMV